MPSTSRTLLPLILLSLAVIGCKNLGGSETNRTLTNGIVAANSTPAPIDVNKDGTIASGTGVEKEKPESGKANVQGKAFFNGQPAVGVEAKLCSKFNQYSTGCGGDTYTAKTDAAGEYLIKNVPPGIYEGLTVRVFDTPFYVFATNNIAAAAKYKIEADKTFFAPDSNLFKNDLKVTAPKAGSRIAAENIEVKWDVYPDAAYYKLSIHPDVNGGGKANYDYINKRVDDPNFILDKPLEPGNYYVRIDAFNANDRKLAQSSRDMKFTVK